MRAVAYSEFHAEYAAIRDSVVNDREEVVVAGAGRGSVVLVALDDYESLKETAHLSRAPEKIVACSRPSNDSTAVSDSFLAHS